MSLEQSRKEHRRELAQRDEELEEIRASTHKKVKALECQLEAEHSERTSILKERHDLDRRLSEAEETLRTSQAYYQEQIHRFRKDLKKTKALLRDAQITIQQSQAETPNKALLRQLRNQIEDAECARNAAIKAKQHAEAEISEAVTAMEDALKIKQDVEEKLIIVMKEKSNLQVQLDENEEELTEVLKKYRASVGQVSVGQLTIQEQNVRIAELENERSSLKERVAELQSRLENLETLADPTSSYHVKRYQLKTKELESKLELEQTTRTRIEVQVARLKETAEKLQNELELSRSRDQAAQESLRKTERALRETREQNLLLAQHDSEASAKKKELEKRLESSEAETAAVRADLRLAMQRVEDLQCAIQGDLDGNITASER
ncbi:hypothetical protein AAG570_012958 [Ranatra chinensis]|uniref:Uncharacterized protein n=1 Tax=Ranatra chinensis TaxID=642074 RepID=A0ABD0YFI9_9HEMI